MTQSIEIDESLIGLLTELKKRNSRLKDYSMTGLVHYLLTEAVKREMNLVEETANEIHLLDGNMEKLIEGKEKNIDKLNLLETKA